MGAVGNAFCCVFQGAVDAFLASTAPAASTDCASHARKIGIELGHFVESAIRGLRLERPLETGASAKWTVRNIQWEVALRAPVQG